MDIEFIQLAQFHINEPPPLGWPVLYDIQILRREEYHIGYAEQLTGLAYGNPIDGNALWLVLFQMHVNAVRDIVFPYLQFNMGFILIEPDDIPVLGAFM